MNYFTNASQSLGYANCASRAPLSTPFVEANHKTCAMQHLVAQTADAASLLDFQHETFGVEGFYSEVLWQFCKSEEHK